MLHYAAGNADDEVVLMLLRYGADKNKRIFNTGPRPYDFALHNPKLSERVRNMLK